jgi:hypothetical protein
MSSPIFIVGPPRSGTTLTAKVLGRHPRLFMPGETHFFDDIYMDRQRLGESFDPACRDRIFGKLRTLYGRYNEPADQIRIDELLTEAWRVERLKASWHSYRQVFSSFMELQMEGEGKSRWGNNAPRDIFHVATILAFYPDAKIVVCVRDIRDFLLSYKGKWKVTAPEDVERLKRLYHPVTMSLLWRASVRQLFSIRRWVPPENLLIVFYEQLVTNPEQTVREICRVIGEEFVPGMLNVDSHNSSHGAGAQGIFTTSIGRWKQQLSPEEAWIAQAVAGEDMRRLGFESERLEVKVGRLLSLAATFPVSLVSGLNANREKRGPLVPYLMRRMGSQSLGRNL